MNMKKLLVVPILLFHYIVVLIVFPIDVVLVFFEMTFDWLCNIIHKIRCKFEDYVMEPSTRIFRYAQEIMKSDKTIKHLHEMSERIKRGKPID